MCYYHSVGKYSVCSWVHSAQCHHHPKAAMEYTQLREWILGSIQGKREPHNKNSLSQLIVLPLPCMFTRPCLPTLNWEATFASIVACHAQNQRYAPKLWTISVLPCCWLYTSKLYAVQGAVWIKRYVGCLYDTITSGIATLPSQAKCLDTPSGHVEVTL